MKVTFSQKSAGLPRKASCKNEKKGPGGCQARKGIRIVS
jgi:hypothetical protein